MHPTAVSPELPARRSPIITFFVGVWDVLNFIRRLIFNMMFYGLLLLFGWIFFSALGSVKPLQEHTTLVLAPEGTLVEQFSTEPVTRALARKIGDSRREEVQLRDVLRVLKAARDDKRIERVLLNVDYLQPSGFASLREVAAALADLRASGKQVVAFSEGMGQGQYLLAAQANEVYLDPMGGLMLQGLASYRQYYRRGLQDMLGVDVHLFRVGEYKSAAEPYILDAASKESKEADLFWMNDIWQRYLDDIAAARKLTAQQISDGIDNLPAALVAADGDQARLALQQQLVDGLKTREEVERLMAERGVADAGSEYGFRSIDFKNYLLQLDMQRQPRGNNEIAVVVAAGEISGGQQPAGRIGGESTSALLRQAREDDNVKAVVLRVDSPGGEVFASEQIRREVVALKAAGKPVVVSMGDLAASGGYWISMNADRIYADASTISGSIGIFGLVPNLTRTLDKIGVRTDGVGTTRFAGAFDITRPLNPDVGKLIQTAINKGYADFTGKVADARKQSVEQIDTIARGRVWSGAQAKERGLVDELGGLDAAIADAATRVKLDSGAYRVRYIERTGTPFEQLLSGFANSSIGAAWLKKSDFAHALLAKSMPQTEAQLRFVENAMQDRDGAPVKALAYCFCGLK